MSKGNRILAALAAALWASLPAWGQDANTVKIETSRQESNLVEVAAADFAVEGADALGLGSSAAAIISADLEFSGYFKPSRQKEFIAEYEGKDRKAQAVDYDAWRTISSNFLIKGKVMQEAGSRVTVEIYVFDLQRRQLDYSKRYTAPMAQFRQMIHQISDDFIYDKSGSKGVSRSSVLFVSTIRGRKELMMVDYDGANPRQITTERTLVVSPNWNLAKSSLILFTTYRYRNPDLYAMDLATKQRYPLSTEIGLNSTGEWSPDGTRVAFALSRGGNTDIYIVNADGRGLIRLTDGRSAELNPSWSPDGKKIAYTSDASGSPQIYVMNSDGTGRERFSSTGRYSDGAAWSPKGDFIAYATLMFEKFDIAVQEARGAATALLTEGYGNGNNETPSWARDNLHLVYSSSGSGARQLHTISRMGGEPVRITDLAGGGSQPSWGP